MIKRAPRKHQPPPQRGNASKFKVEYVRMAKFMAQRGAIQSEIADAFNVSTQTITNWINQHPDFQDAIRAGNDVFNARDNAAGVIDQLFKVREGQTSN